MGKVLNVQENLVALPRRTAISLSSLVGLVLSQIDPILQRVAASVGLSRFASSRFTPEGVRAFNRVIISIWIIIMVTFMSLLHYESSVLDIIADVEIPILGSQEQDISLVYPPIGNKFYPRVADYNLYSKYRPRTPLLIPFTRNNTMIKQTVISYIAAGWPRADIVIVDNSGTMDANSRGQLSRDNPFYLDYDLYRKRYGITLIQTPTLMSFAQLQNFMLRISLARNWPYFFWSHMDIAVLSAEEATPYKSFYHRVIDVLDSSGVDQWEITARQGQNAATQPSIDRKEIFSGHFDRILHKEPDLQKKSKREIRSKPKWGVKLFAYDYLTLVNVEAWRDIGAWDTFIPYYATDCDAYERLKMAGYTVEEVSVGHVFDIADVITSPEERFFPAPNQQVRDKWGVGPAGSEPDGGKVNSWRYKWLKSELTELMDRKATNKAGRNYWQKGGRDVRKMGKGGKPRRGKMEPWTYDPRGFSEAWWGMADAGRGMYIKKWGTMDCDLRGAGKTLDDIWLLEYVEKGSEVRKVREKQEEEYKAKLDETYIR